MLQCAETVGAMDSVFESTLAYMGERYAFGRPIASFQALKHRIADMLLQLESAKATTDAAAAADRRRLRRRPSSGQRGQGLRR